MVFKHIIVLYLARFSIFGFLSLWRLEFENCKLLFDDIRFFCKIYVQILYLMKCSLFSPLIHFVIVAILILQQLFQVFSLTFSEVDRLIAYNRWTCIYVARFSAAV